MPRPRTCGLRRRGRGGCSRSRNETSGSWARSEGLDVVELACGTAYFSAWLARAGADTVAVDLSGEQLTTARRMQRQVGPVFPLVQGDTERVPLASGRFDLVVSEHGAAAWCDPSAGCRKRPAATTGRKGCLLDQQPPVGAVRPGRGRRGGRPAATRSTGGLPGAWSGGGLEFHPSHGDWVRLLRRSGFLVEALHEVYAPPDRADHPFYEIVSHEWATRWPAEELWVAQRR